MCQKKMLSLGVCFFLQVSPLDTRVTWIGSDAFMGTCITQVYYSFSNGVACEAPTIKYVLKGGTGSTA